MSDAVDVLIVGGGLAGLSLASLLQAELPQARVRVLDRPGGLRRKVGESTVEIGAHFLHTRLGLADFLARTQLPKNGLRFWFDTEERSATFSEASEDGPATYAQWRSYQVEREPLEAELRRRLRIPVEVARGVEVGRAGGEHVVRYRNEAGVACAARGRWLVDATGVRALTGRASGAVVADARVPHGACWARVRGAGDLDALVEGGVGEAAGRGFNFAPRRLSTNHVMGRGYWVWLIPLASGSLSVGVVYDPREVADPPVDEAGWWRFVRRHACLRELLEGAEVEDVGVLRGYGRRGVRYVGEDRLVRIGVAGGFADPFYSNGVDFIALGCEAVLDLVGRELEGEELDRERVAAHDGTLRRSYEQSVQFVAGLYPSFASHRLSEVRYRRDTHVYWCLYAWSYFGRRLTDLEYVRGLHGLADRALRRGRWVSAWVADTARVLEERGELYEGNVGRYTFNQLGYRTVPVIRFEPHMGAPPVLERCGVALEEVDVATALALLDVRFGGDRSPTRALCFEAMRGVIEPVYEAWARCERFDAGVWEEVFGWLTRGVRAVVEPLGVDLSGWALTPETYGRWVPEVLARCADPEVARAVRRFAGRAPELHDFDDLPAERGGLQEEGDWSGNPSPWLGGEPVFESIYDVLGTCWWRRPKRPLGSLGTLAEARRRG